MDVVINSETLELLLDGDKQSMPYASALQAAREALDTKEEYAIITWNDEEVRDHIKDVYGYDISDEHAVDMMNLIEETNSKNYGFSFVEVEKLFATHLKHHYDK